MKNLGSESTRTFDSVVVDISFLLSLILFQARTVLRVQLTWHPVSLTLDFLTKKQIAPILEARIITRYHVSYCFVLTEENTELF